MVEAPPRISVAPDELEPGPGTLRGHAGHGFERDALQMVMVEGPVHDDGRRRILPGRHCLRSKREQLRVVAVIDWVQPFAGATRGREPVRQRV
jgi:hypothetical protein